MVVYSTVHATFHMLSLGLATGTKQGMYDNHTIYMKLS